MRAVKLFAVLVFFSSTLLAQYNIDDLSFMAGDWHGEGFGGKTYESWSVPLGGTMLGVFSIVKHDETKLYEFLTVEEKEEEIYFRFKHFSPGYNQWEEEPITLKLEELSGTKAVFTALERNDKLPKKLIYDYLGENKLKIQIVGWEEEDGKETYEDLYFEK